MTGRENMADKKQTKVKNFVGTIREKVFMDRYALKAKDGSFIEHTPEETWARVARGIAQNEKAGAAKNGKKHFMKSCLILSLFPVAESSLVQEPIIK